MKFLIAAVLTLAFSSFASSEELELVTQAIGDQCSVIATYVPPAKGGCGGDTSEEGDIKVGGTMNVVAGKTYYAQFYVVDSSVTSVTSYASDEYRAAKTETWTIPRYLIPAYDRSPQRVKMEIVDADTKAVLCRGEIVVTPTAR
jgi:hypothetical protein